MKARKSIRSRKKRIKVQDRIRKFKFLTSSFFVLLLGVGLIVYIFQVNIVTLKGYKLKEKKLELSHLKDNYHQLMVEEAKLRAVDRVEKGIESLEMENIANIVYLEIQDSSIAKR